MLETKSVEETIRSRLIGSVLAYVRGDNTINWVIGIANDEKYGKPSKETITDVFNRLGQHHGNDLRFQQLETKFKELGLL